MNAQVVTLFLGLGLSQVARRLNLDGYLWQLRGLYLGVHLLLIGLYLYIAQKIRQKNDNTLLKYAEGKPMSSQTGEPPSVVTTTLCQYDLLEVSKAMRGLFTGVAMTLFMHLCVSARIFSTAELTLHICSYLKFTQPLLVSSLTVWISIWRSNVSCHASALRSILLTGSTRWCASTCAARTERTSSGPSKQEEDSWAGLDRSQTRRLSRKQKRQTYCTARKSTRQSRSKAMVRNKQSMGSLPALRVFPQQATRAQRLLDTLLEFPYASASRKAFSFDAGIRSGNVTSTRTMRLPFFPFAGIPSPCTTISWPGLTVLPPVS